MSLGNDLLNAEDAEALAEVRKAVSAYLCENLRAPSALKMYLP